MNLHSSKSTSVPPSNMCFFFDDYLIHRCFVTSFQLWKNQAIHPFLEHIFPSSIELFSHNIEFSLVLKILYFAQLTYP